MYLSNGLILHFVGVQPSESTVGKFDFHRWAIWSNLLRWRMVKGYMKWVQATILGI